MLLALFAKGAVLGVTIALPVGPIALRLIQLTLMRGFRAGAAGGLGAAAADATYGAVAAFGLSWLAEMLVGAQVALRLAGALILLWLAFGTWRSAARPTVAPMAGQLEGFIGTFLLTLTNPLTILGFAGAFAAIGLASAPGMGAAAVLVAGLFLGSAAYQLLICAVAALARRRITHGLAWTGRVAALLLAAYGLAALYSVVS